MKKFLILFLLIFYFGGKKEIKSSDLILLNGYWNIEFITYKDETFYPKGSTKLLDFYEVIENIGIRKKVQPNLLNQFLVSDDFNSFEIIFKNRNYYLSYKTSWDQWQEKIIELNKNKLVLEHQNKRYHYKRFLSEY